MSVLPATHRPAAGEHANISAPPGLENRPVRGAHSVEAPLRMTPVRGADIGQAPTLELGGWDTPGSLVTPQQSERPGTGETWQVLHEAATKPAWNLVDPEPSQAFPAMEGGSKARVGRRSLSTAATTAHQPRNNRWSYRQ